MPIDHVSVQAPEYKLTSVAVIINVLHLSLGLPTFRKGAELLTNSEEIEGFGRNQLNSKTNTDYLQSKVGRWKRIAVESNIRPMETRR